MSILDLRPRYFVWTNLPWGQHPDKMGVSGTGHLEPDEPDEQPTDVQDYPTAVRTSTGALGEFLIADPAKDTPETLELVYRHYNTFSQLMAWRIAGYRGIPKLAMPQNAALVLQAHDVVQEYAADLRSKVKAPFLGLDLKGLQLDATHLKFIRKMKLAHGIFGSGLDRVDAWLSQGIAQRLYPLFTDALPVIKDMDWLVAPLEPLRQLFAAAADKAQETRGKIAKALGQHGKPGPGTPGSGGPPPGGTPGGTPGSTGSTGTGDPGAHGGPPSGTGTTAGHHGTGHHGTLK